METLISEVVSKFTARFNQAPLLVASPGRINIIGEHTDYHKGYVLPAAIDRYMVGGFSESGEKECSIYSIDYDEEILVDPNKLQPLKKGSWANYVLGVIKELSAINKKIAGFNLVFSGNIPVGAGLSSSAALENCLVYGLNELFRLGLNREEMATVAMRAEHNFVGVECGIMDQYASMLGKKDHAIQLDCENHEATYLRLKMDNLKWVLLNTQVKHSLIDTPFNQRQEECRNGLREIQKTDNNVRFLRHATSAHLKNIREKISSLIHRRCSYVIEENERVLEAVKLLESGEWEKLGSLLYESHVGLQHKYEVSCPELDFLVDQTRDKSDVLGSRMMGGGFGGCTLNLVRKSYVDTFLAEMKELYHNRFNIELTSYIVSISHGSGIIT